MRRALAAVLFACAAGLAACSVGSASNAVGPPPSPEAGPPEPVDAGDAGEDVIMVAVPVTPSLVLVNGLVDAGQSGLDDVRVCITGKPNPLPDAVPMPMSNYPGIARGTGVDLGGVSAVVTMLVFRATDLQSDAAWTTRKSCDSWEFSSTKRTKLTLSLMTGANLAVLVDDPKGTDGINVRTGALPAQYAGQKDTLQMVAAEFSTFAKAGETLEVSVDGNRFGAGASGVLSPTAYGFPTLGASLDSSKIRFDRRNGDAGTAFFEQTLGSVQFLADPTTTPASYFDHRVNYAFVLLGDATQPVATDAKDVQFNGKGLHVAAVPYAVVTQ